MASLTDVSQAPELWEQGTESGRQVVVLGLAVALTVAAVQQLTAGRVGLFFDLSFVTLCVLLAFVVRRESFYTVGLLPPVLMLAVFVLVALADPAALARPQDSVVQAVVSGLATHATALAAGYAATLGVLFWRRREFLADVFGQPEPDPGSDPGPGPGQPSNREVSPAPTRVTSG